MKKIAIVVAMFMLASPAWAVVDVNIIPVPIGTTGDVNITYVADANISGFGLDITVDTGANITAINNFHFGESNSTAKGFGIFPGSIDINSVTGQVDYYGTPAAPNTDPCALGGIGTAGVTIEMGALYEDGNAPDWTGTLCTVTVSADCNITVALNARRGGVVREDFADANTNLPITVPVTVVSLCTVPNVVGGSKAAADTAIEAAGLVANGTGVLSCVTLNQVLTQDPAGSTQVTCGSTVDYDYSLYQTTVPSIVGGSKAAADTAIAAAGLVANGTGVLSCEPINEVLTQDPAGSTQVACSSTVDYDYSLYETTVPNILNMTGADANAAIIAAGLSVGTIDYDTSWTVDVNLVMDQDPNGGTQVSCNPSTVSYTKSSGCYPKALGGYGTWISAGKPDCWCYPYHCKGDTDGLFDGKDVYGKRQYVVLPDLWVLAGGWQKLDNDPNFSTFICADFDTAFDGKNVYGKRQYVVLPDLWILADGWQKLDNDPCMVNNPCFP